MTRPFLRRLIDAATAPYRPAGRFAWHFARGKLGRDPVFTGILAHGLLPPQASVLDLGCGQGLLSNWLTAAARLHAAGDWPAGWPPPPGLVSYRGIELMQRDVDRARPALPSGAVVEQGDIRDAAFSRVNAVVILDSLHYIDPDAQRAVLVRVRNTLTLPGTLVMRVGDAAGGLPFRLSNWVDRLVTFVRGHRLGTLYCRPATEWCATLEELGFSVRMLPMDDGTPFSNTMLIGRFGDDRSDPDFIPSKGESIGHPG